MTLLTALFIKHGSYEYQIEEGIIQPEVEIAISEDQNVSKFEHVIDSVNIAVASQGFVFALFPIYSSMAQSARPKVMTSVTSALFFTCTTYTFLSCISIAYFGQENIKPSIFENIQQQPGLASVFLRCLFLLIFLCNIPFVFFAGKAALLAVVD